MAQPDEGRAQDGRERQLNPKSVGLLLIIMFGFPLTLGGAATLNWSVNEYYWLSANLVSAPVGVCSTTQTNGLILTTTCKFTAADAESYIIASVVILFVGIVFVVVGVRMLRRNQSPTTKVGTPVPTTKETGQNPHLDSKD